MQVHRELRPFKADSRELCVIVVVLDEQHFRRPAARNDAHTVLPFSAGIVKKKVLPRPGRDSTQILPPWRWSTRRQTASPIPVPGISC